MWAMMAPIMYGKADSKVSGDQTSTKPFYRKGNTLKCTGFTFPNSGVTLTFNIPISAQQQQGGFPGGPIINGATANNGSENFQVVKLDGRELVVDGDGVQLNMVYLLYGGQL